MDINRLAPLVVTLIHAAFDSHQSQFAAITRRARERFERQDWRGGQEDAALRLAIYRWQVDGVLAEVRRLLHGEVTTPDLWACAKAEYERLVRGREDAELAETFFNSVVRRIFATVGVDPRTEFVSQAGGESVALDGTPIYRTYHPDGGTTSLVRRLLADVSWEPGYANLDRDALLVAGVVDDAVRCAWGEGALDAVDVIDAVFFRNKGAYLVGRLVATPGRERAPIPLVLPLLREAAGVHVDAALTSGDEASVVFGFSWSYFHVDAPRPRALVEFLRSIMPHKRIDELYNSIGFNRHGKTELYRTLLEHLESPGAKFEVAEGEEGLVMSVFTLPSLNVVFKIIKDAFGPTKKTTRQAVKEKYQLVFQRDRVGRLADAQEFEHLAFPRACFSDALLDHLLAVCGRTVRVEGDRIVVSHLYTERRVTPLNLHLRHADPEAARAAIVDYGRSIKDLAAANIFAGDMLLKNFGVTRHGRVIFYDYDELVLLTECNFRRIPPARDMDDEMAAEPWFHVAEDDVFPEEFDAFMLPAGRLREAFMAHHADLLDVAFWQRMQALQRAGEIVDFFPYPESRRFPRA